MLYNYTPEVFNNNNDQKFENEKEFSSKVSNCSDPRIDTFKKAVDVLYKLRMTKVKPN